MAKQKIHTEVDGHKIELSNLGKVLYPDDGIVKAEVIDYYLRIAPTILNHIRGRALSLIRFPDGIYGEQFFQKHRPDWTPDWIEYKRLGQERQKEYVVANKPATLVWLANLACLELHQIHSFAADSSRPDYIVYDLDPPEGFLFEELKSIAHKLREHLERFGYHPFVKSTGGKGLHIVTPLEPNYSFDQCFEAAKTITSDFIKKESNTTLHIKKESRKGRVLIDIYRNRPSQTIVCPYSLRGRRGAPASTPLAWHELDTLTDPNDWNLSTTIERVLSDGDAWEGIRGWAVQLHTERKTTVAKDLPEHPSYKTPGQLEEYERKRDFNRTPEPISEMADAEGSRFVIQRHHASHLHYDLRLEQDGVLKSWAIPRGMPPKPGIKRLAVQTEDHPLKYLSFEGEIPKNEYGGGMMWIYATGRYEVTKEKKNGFYFRLSGKQLDAEYRMHLMKDKEWLLERVDTPQKDLLTTNLEPMLAESARKVPSGDYTYEVKWDGIRAMIYLSEGELRIMSRNGNDITAQFPELQVTEAAFRIQNGIFDGEIVCLDAQGRADFKKVLKRLNARKNFEIDSKKNPAHCYLFDCLYLDGRSLMNDPLERRRWWLKDSLRKDTHYRMSESMDDGNALFEAAKELQLEGIMAKERLGKYYAGRRSDTWIKVKVKHTSDCQIIGYSPGEGERQGLFGSLHVMEETNEGAIYRGRVGTGFSVGLMKGLSNKLKGLETDQRVIEVPVHDEKNLVWVRPELSCEIEYSMITHNGTFRDPVFKKLIQE